MTDFERIILDKIVEGQRNDGVDGENISQIVYSFARRNFNPANKRDIDDYLLGKSLPVLESEEGV